MTPVARRKQPPSWRDLIGLGLAAIALLNLLGVTIVLLMGPPPHRYVFIAIMWLVAGTGLTLLVRAWRTMEPRRPPPSRTPRA